MNIILIRHAMTFGNTKKKYIGSTDEDICSEGIEMLKNIIHDKDFVNKIEKVYASPMARCMHTAKIIFPNKKIIEVEDFRECDFGDFENKNYRELQDNEDYKKWLKDGYMESFPNGENIESFKNRSTDAFCSIINQCKKENIGTAACVVHGGTIMSIMEKYDKDKKNYFDYNCRNCGGYICRLDELNKNICLRIDKQW